MSVIAVCSCNLPCRMIEDICFNTKSLAMWRNGDDQLAADDVANHISQGGWYIRNVIKCCLTPPLEQKLLLKLCNRMQCANA